MRTISETISGKEYSIKANNPDNIADAFKLRISYMEWQFSHYGLQGWSFRFVDTLPSNVIAGTLSNVIEINTKYLYLLNWDLWKYVMIHEICHALTPDDHCHGSEWQMACRRLGISSKPVIFSHLTKAQEGIYRLDFDMPVRSLSDIICCTGEDVEMEW